MSQQFVKNNTGLTVLSILVLTGLFLQGVCTDKEKLHCSEYFLKSRFNPVLRQVEFTEETDGMHFSGPVIKVVKQPDKGHCGPASRVLVYYNGYLQRREVYTYSRQTLRQIESYRNNELVSRTTFVPGKGKRRELIEEFSHGKTTTRTFDVSFHPDGRVNEVSFDKQSPLDRVEYVYEDKAFKAEKRFFKNGHKYTVAADDTDFESPW